MKIAAKVKQKRRCASHQATAFLSSLPTYPVIIIQGYGHSS